MRLSAKSEYACLALIDLAEAWPRGLVTIEDIATRRQIPRKYLEQILLTLNRNGYLESRRGAGGGYRLAKPPDSISLADVIRLLDGPLAPVASVSHYFYHSTPISNSPALLALFGEIRDHIAERLEKTTLADLTTKTH